ncbi:MAG: glycogen debranching protein [Candidatus Melainabacteria bacterium]|nr:MAG: glycogen debranching protein [Candidatus Melainabacteria bacterium]
MSCSSEVDRMHFFVQSWLREQTEDEQLEVYSVDLGEKDARDRREYLVTNGLGSYASANIWGANTRRYHGLLVAALKPPVQRMVLFSRIDEVVTVRGVETSLATNYWKSGVTSPTGYETLKGFSPIPVPTWIYQVDGGLLIKQVAMMPEKQQVAVGYTWHADPVRGTEAESAHLRLHLLVNYRDFHSATVGSDSWQFSQHQDGDRVRISAFPGAQPLDIYFDRGTYTPLSDWYRDYYWPRESERGLEDREDCFHVGMVNVELRPGQSVTIFGAVDSVLLRNIDDVVKVSWAHKKSLLASAGAVSAPIEQQALILAADDFVVRRQSTRSNSIIAGYHWFSDWGRDSMISLPGLTLSTGRPQVARSVLETFGAYLSEGMLPNYFPDAGTAPEYNTADATLWWAFALLHYYRESGDANFIREQLPLLESVVEWHQKGTRHGLRMDPVDSLIAGGNAGVQLTWMDAKVGDYVVTPRSGKAVEINALWYNFLKTIEFLYCAVGSASLLENPHGKPGLLGSSKKSEYYAEIAERVQSSFSKFWNEKAGCFHDCIRDDGTTDSSIRPNQLLAASLTFPVATKEQARSMLKIVEEELLTPKGLRTLSPHDARYAGIYGGGKVQANQYDRDITYHQGTVWPWMFGPWVDCRMYAYGNEPGNHELIAEKLQTIVQHIFGEGCLGSISEIFDGDAPHAPRGCVAQAWSVAELLRVLRTYPELVVIDTACHENCESSARAT